MKHASGFTLIEVVIGLSISAIVTTAALAVVSQVNRTQVEGQVRAQIIGDARLVTTMLAKDLAFLGAGVPRGYRYDTADFAGCPPTTTPPTPCDAHQLRPPIRLGHPDNIVFVGDLPYPNAELNGIVQILDVRGGAAFDHLDIASELSPCVPQTGAGSYRCPNNTMTLVPGPVAGAFGAGDKCTSGTPGSRLCPWAMNKWEDTSAGANHIHLAIGTPAGSWYEREWDGTTTASDAELFGVNLSSGAPNGSSWNAGGSSSLKAPPLGDPVLQKLPGAFAATIDRVFWSWETPAGGACPGAGAGCVLKRRQCWGRIDDPAAAGFPGVGDTAFRSGSTPANCNPAQRSGTNWETIATNVDAFTLTYTDKTDTPVNPPWDIAKSSSVRAVQVDLTITRNVPSTSATTSYSIRRKYFLDNRGGLTEQPPPLGTPPPPPGRHRGGGCGDSCGDSRG